MQVTYIGPNGPVEARDGADVHLAHFGDTITVTSETGASLLAQTDEWQAKPFTKTEVKALHSINDQAAVDHDAAVALLTHLTTGTPAVTAPEATPQ